MRMMRIVQSGTFALAVFLIPVSARPQDLLKEAVRSFPPQTIRLEYSHPAKLRTLPNYAALRQRYEGPRLRVLEQSLSQLGVRESDIDQLVLGWQAGSSEMDLEGFASGRFDAKAVAEAASERGISSATVGDGQTAYCLGSDAGSTCIAFLGNSLGIFGKQDSLQALLQARAGDAPNLSSDDHFMRLLGEAKTQAPIWGVGVGPAVADWFRGWMATQGNSNIDWSRALGDVEALAYSVEAADQVNLNMVMDCTTPEAADSLRQAFEGLKALQQLAWQNRNSGQPNPYQSLEIGLRDRRLTLKLAAAYSALEVAGGPGPSTN